MRPLRVRVEVRVRPEGQLREPEVLQQVRGVADPVDGGGAIGELVGRLVCVACGD